MELKEDNKLRESKNEKEILKKDEKCQTIKQIKIFSFHHFVIIFRTRQNRQRMQQEAQRDAPDPRESRPPCYADAILMPRLEGSFASLNELGSGRLKHSRRRRKTEEADDIEEEEVQLRRNRCRSEEVISMREVVAASVRPSRMPPRLHPVEIQPISRSDEEPEELHYHSTDILALDHSPGPSSRARSPQVSVQHDNENVSELRDFNQSSSNTLERSPYANRKLGHMESFKSDKARMTAPASTTTAVKARPQQVAFEIHEDHFKPIEPERASISSDDSCEFITIKPGKQTDSNSSSNEDGLVILHRPTSI